MGPRTGQGFWVSHLGRGQASRSRGTVGQHLLLSISAAEAGGGRIVHGPVPGAEQLLDTLRYLRRVPVFVAHRTGSIAEEQDGGRW